MNEVSPVSTEPNPTPTRGLGENVCEHCLELCEHCLNLCEHCFTLNSDVDVISLVLICSILQEAKRGSLGIQLHKMTMYPKVNDKE